MMPVAIVIYREPGISHPRPYKVITLRGAAYLELKDGFLASRGNWLTLEEVVEIVMHPQVKEVIFGRMARV